MIGVWERKVMKLHFCVDISGDVRLRGWVKGAQQLEGGLLLSRILG